MRQKSILPDTRTGNIFAAVRGNAWRHESTHMYAHISFLFLPTTCYLCNLQLVISFARLVHWLAFLFGALQAGITFERFNIPGKDCTIKQHSKIYTQMTECKYTWQSEKKQHWNKLESKFWENRSSLPAGGYARTDILSRQHPRVPYCGVL